MSQSSQLPATGDLALLAHYHAQPGVADELLDASGCIRPVWHPFLAYLSGLTADQFKNNLARGEQYLRDAGVYYRQSDAGVSAEHDWPLSPIPVLIDEADWNSITTGLIQRADLLEVIVRDLYGENRLAEGGHIPPELIAQSVEWLRPLVGTVPRGGHFLNFIAFEIGRGPDGEWWVLGDRTQAPSGAGFALENRVATSRIFSDYFTGANIHRLAGFFRNFRDTLNDMRGNQANRVSILTPGPLNETYFEHAYIARYLGFGLLEGEDLVVENGKVMVRTVAGLIPVDVLWRRLDSHFADPVELDTRSQIGTAGLASAARSGAVTLVNALGSGILEMRALLAFMPRLSKHILGEPLALPNIATWWCGQGAEADFVRKNLGRMTISEALSTQLPFETSDQPTLTGLVARGGHTSLDHMLATDGARFVGQELVTLSTTPALIDGVLQPRPMSLRVFLARTAQGWQVMPGGYARIGGSRDSTAIAMRRGGSAADVWIVSANPVEAATMLAPPRGPFTRAVPGTLPSRAADNLFWLGRYVERTEGHLRLLRAYHQRLSDGRRGSGRLLENLETSLTHRGLSAEQAFPDGLSQTIASALNSASKIRDRFSIDGWLALNDLAKTARSMSERIGHGDDCARAMGVLLRKLSGFTGLVHENMYRFVGWRFMSIGRALERAQFMAANLTALARPDAPDGALDLAVEIGDSILTHRRRYTVTTTRETVVDLLGLDALNPRSILFSANDIQEHIAYLPGANSHGQVSSLSRAVLRMQASIAVLTPETLDEEALASVGGQISDLSDLLTSTYFQ